MAIRGDFFKEFIKDRREVGALAPSSKALAKKICSNINFSETKTIVELGPGDGIFTTYMLEMMRKDAELYVFETNLKFYRHLEESINDDRCHLFHESAEHIVERLKDHGHKQVDVIVSSLPLTIIPKDVKQNVLDASSKLLKPRGLYLQYQYSLNARKLLKTTFDSVNIQFTALNFPPAFVYKCSKSG